MMNNSWDSVLDSEYQKDYFKKLINYIDDEYLNEIIYPSKENIFNAFNLTDYNNVKVVILGQDPYHGEGEAMGLSFSVPNDIKRPPSLRNIFKELESDLGIIREENDLTKWAKEGVLLLNAILTVKKDTPLYHKDKGWEVFTDNVIRLLNDYERPLVFILWGNYARSKKSLITNPKHFVIESAHPSPLSASRGFFGSKPFSKTNEFLEKNNMKGIDW